MKFDAEEIEKLTRVADRHGIHLLLLFGSALTANRHSDSDLDIAVLFQEERGLTGAEYSQLVHALQEIFPDQTVDLGILNHADPLFLKKVTENCRLLYGAPERLVELKLYAFKRYQDHRRYFEMERRYVERFLKKAGAAP